MIQITIMTIVMSLTWSNWGTLRIMPDHSFSTFYTDELLSYIQASPFTTYIARTFTTERLSLKLLLLVVSTIYFSF